MSQVMEWLFKSTTGSAGFWKYRRLCRVHSAQSVMQGSASTAGYAGL